MLSTSTAERETKLQRDIPTVAKCLFVTQNRAENILTKFILFCLVLTTEAYFTFDSARFLLLCYKYTGVADDMFRLVHFKPSTTTADRKT